ncbi:hypothetical protein KUTeg_015861 [Tegillarca granosa]|uniref:Uncharacterized protein n=1 Tax=Tegillarca granosa TaxID=220873 RepID=A0ABQ9EJ87_TEGGR|nr:hypothetical protein KUTeg_015861 [Tegillarca granosa]
MDILNTLKGSNTLLAYIVSVLVTVSCNYSAQTIDLSTLSTCETTAILSYKLSAPEDLSSCELEFWITGMFSTNNVALTSSNRTITLKGLNENTEYQARITCLMTHSNIVHFSTKKCSTFGPTTTLDDEESVVLYKEKQIISSSTLDIVLGLVFAIAALIILAVALYYYYRRCQRQQRLQRFFSTPHTDPFENLQDYIEGES